MTLPQPDIADLLRHLDQCLGVDRHRLRRQLLDLRKRPDEARLAQWQARFQASCAKVQARRDGIPAIRYDDALPIAARRDEIKAALEKHQVLVVAGETGSGKTTQLPKICLEAGRGVHGLIGHTQPRRLAARSVATRIAEELATPLGQTVGYQVRFEDHSSESSLIKLMTDGILLAETLQDRFLEKYDTIIVDEAHERSLNIDFLLGYLKTLLPRRPDLKVIITSATIDLERFSRHFDSAPVIEVSGRTYPVETWYRPLAAELDENGEPLMDDLTVDQGILAALDEIDTHERQVGQRPGDVLVFLPGEREIREAADALRKAELRFTEVLPLYARLTPAEQQKIFRPLPARKVVLATNVAETSLTVPGIRYVIDSGTARISRYSYRAKVQRLPVEAVSKASANQRKGRCGRVEPGICIRLYSEQDFLGRPEFTDPEILRTNLAAVILQMLHLRLGDIQQFPFIEPPEGKAVSDGFTLLQELCAVGRDNKLTDIGRQLARLPVDPRLGRMLLEAAKLGSLQEVLIVISALSVQDPRERPVERRPAADQAHAQWKDPESDFAALINLWRGFEEQRQALGASALRNWCKKNFLNYMRLREWRDAHRQLHLLCRELKLDVAGKGDQKPPSPQPSPKGRGGSGSGAPLPLVGEGLGERASPGERAVSEAKDRKVNAIARKQEEQSEAAQRAQGYAAVHQAILAGLLSQIGQKSEEGDYQGARQRRFLIHPASVIGRKKSNWVMAAELVETTRLYARMVARIEPDWLEPLAAHLLKVQYLEPHWEKKRGQVVAYEQATLYGLIVVARRPRHYGPIDPVVSRELFIREGLVGGEINSRAHCLQANRQLLERLDTLEAKARRRDILADEEALYAFYDKHVPADIYQTASFDSWYKKQSANNPQLLLMTEQDVLAREATEVTGGQYPDSLQLGQLQLPLSYEFQPGTQSDGVTLRVPAPLLPQLPAERLQWLVPGLLYDKCVALLRGLPKSLRKNFVPVPDFAQAALGRLTFGEGSLYQSLGRELQRMTGVRIADEAWSEAEQGLEAHLRMLIQVIDGAGRVLGQGRDLSDLTARFAEESQAALAIPTQQTQQPAVLDAGHFAQVPGQVQQSIAGLSMTVYPALQEEGGVVRESRFPTRSEADYQHRRALQRLLLQQLAEQAKYLRGKLPGSIEMGLLYRELGKVDSLVEDILLASVDNAILAGQERLPRSAQALTALAEAKRGDWTEQAERLARLVLGILKQWHELQKRFKGKIDLTRAVALNDIKGQLAQLVYPGFVRDTPMEWLQEYPRYLKATDARLEKLPGQLQKDRVWSSELADYWQRYQARLNKHLKEGKRDPELESFRWMLEEYRVSLWAQQLGTTVPVSAKRLDKQWASTG